VRAAGSSFKSAFAHGFLAMLPVHIQTHPLVRRLHAISLAALFAVGLALAATSPSRGEESPAYAIEVSDVTAKVGERAILQAKLRVRDGYRILQSYNNRVIKLSAEDDGVAFEQDMVRAKIEEGALVFAVPLRATKPGKHPVNGLFRVGYIHDGGDEMAMVSLRLIASVTGTQ
jgi:hypothetical protein